MTCLFAPTRGNLRHAPLEDHRLDARREPYALKGWTLQVLYCDPKGRKAHPRILSTEWRSVRLG